MWRDILSVLMLCHKNNLCALHPDTNKPLGIFSTTPVICCKKLAKARSLTNTSKSESKKFILKCFLLCGLIFLSKLLLLCLRSIRACKEYLKPRLFRPWVSFLCGNNRTALRQSTSSTACSLKCSILCLSGGKIFLLSRTKRLCAACWEIRILSKEHLILIKRTSTSTKSCLVFFPRN